MDENGNKGQGQETYHKHNNRETNSSMTLKHTLRHLVLN